MKGGEPASAVAVTANHAAIAASTRRSRRLRRRATPGSRCSSSDSTTVEAESAARVNRPVRRSGWVSAPGAFELRTATGITSP
jgi:hypothetical protein